MIYDYFSNISFAQPYSFILLIILPVLIVMHYRGGSFDSASFHISTLSVVPKTGNLKIALRHLPFWLRMIALLCIILALARPQTKYDETFREGEGVDIMLAIDVSGSMTMQDFTPNRIEAAKKVAIDFVNHRPNDRIGVVIFAGESFTQCPLTTDHYVLIHQIEQIRVGMLVDGTAIGDGLAKSVDRLRSSKAKSKVIVLLTDGVNNTGLIDPAYAKEIAKTFHVKVYTIAIGTEAGTGGSVERTPLGSVRQTDHIGINEKLLQNIANETGGLYFRASDNQDLTKIYQDINELEKSKVQITTFHRQTERFYPLVFLAIGLLFLELVLSYTIFRKFP